jgi:hypothetical protein
MLNGRDRHSVLSQDRYQPAPTNHSVLFCMEQIMPWDEPQQAVPIVCLAQQVTFSETLPGAHHQERATMGANSPCNMQLCSLRDLTTTCNCAAAVKVRMQQCQQALSARCLEQM